MPLKDAGILFEGEDEYAYEEEATQKLDALISEIDTLPAWAQQLACVMPNWGFEACSHRWTDGLDEILSSIRNSKFSRSAAGHCGDVPTSVYNSIFKTLSAAETDASDEKQKSCLRALLKLFEARQVSHDEMKQCYAENTDAFAPFFEKENAEKFITTGIACSCGFKVPSILQLLIDHISGKDVPIGKSEYNCLASFRYASEEEWERIGFVVGIMHGIQSYLENTPLPTGTLYQGYAKITHEALSASKADSKVLAFLATHFFYALQHSHKIICDRFGKFAPEEYQSLPALS